MPNQPKPKLHFGAVGLALMLGAFGCRDKSPSETPPPLEPTPAEPMSADEPAPEPEAEINDLGITRAIQRRLLFDHRTSSAGIDVETNEGIVELTGTVDNLLAKIRATRIAESIKGVRSVSNRVTVEAESVDDAELADDVKAALLYDPAAESYEIAVTAEQGKVTLTGKVESWAEKQIAEQVAASVRGVSQIDNRITVEYAADRADSEIAREIEKILDWDVLVGEDRIEVTVEDGKVKLAGVVGSAAERTRAEARAWTSGVVSVDTEELEVDWVAADPDVRERRFEVRSPEQIADAIKDAALYDPRVRSYEIRPVVHGTAVTLYGTVGSLHAKNAAEQLARNTVGVATVVNEIEVEPPGEPDDEEIEKTILARLLTNVYTDGHEIEVGVEDGVATLTGTVDSYFEKAEASEIASRARGVVLVNNLLQVKYPEVGFFYDPYLYPYYPYVAYWHTYAPGSTTATDADIEADIESELFWSPFVDADQVNVSVERGRATLTGTVDSWRERAAATQNAYEGGALFVDNLLHVDL